MQEIILKIANDGCQRRFFYINVFKSLTEHCSLILKCSHLGQRASSLLPTAWHAHTGALKCILRPVGRAGAWWVWKCRKILMQRKFVNSIKNVTTRVRWLQEVSPNRIMGMCRFVQGQHSLLHTVVALQSARLRSFLSPFSKEHSALKCLALNLGPSTHKAGVLPPNYSLSPFNGTRQTPGLPVCMQSSGEPGPCRHPCIHPDSQTKPSRGSVACFMFSPVFCLIRRGWFPRD